MALVFRRGLPYCRGMVQPAQNASRRKKIFAPDENPWNPRAADLFGCR